MKGFNDSGFQQLVCRTTYPRLQPFLASPVPAVIAMTLIAQRRTGNTGEIRGGAWQDSDASTSSEFANYIPPVRPKTVENIDACLTTASTVHASPSGT